MNELSRNSHSELGDDAPNGTRANPYAASNLHPSRSDRLIDPYENIHDYAEIDPAYADIELREFEEQEIPSMRTVKSGLSYYYSGLYLMTFCFFVGSFARRIIGAQLASLIMYGTTLGAFVVLIGELKCLAIPRRAGGFQQVLISVFFYSGCVALHLLKNAMQVRGNIAPAFFVQIGLLQLIAGFFANFFFLSFIVSLTHYLRHGRLHQKALKTRRDIWTMIGFVVVVFFTFVLLVNPRAGNAQPIAFIVLGMGTVAFLIMLYSWLHRFTRLVKDTCDAIEVE